MSLALKRHVFKRDLWLEKFFKIMNALKLSKFCWLFTLRQGTILIAIIELSLTSFCLFLLFLCATHAQDIVDLVTSDLQRLEENSLPEGNIKESPTYFINNEKKMLDGQHMAFIVMFIVWAGLLVSSIHFISTVLLLYGAIRRYSSFLLPWTSTALFALISGFFFITIVAFLPLPGCKFGTLVVLTSLYGLEWYSWLTVFSYYQELKATQIKGFGGVVHNISSVEKGLAATQSIQTLKLDYHL